MLYAANLGCLAMRVISSAQESSKTIAANCLCNEQWTKSESQSKKPIRTIIVISNQFSKDTRYRFSEPDIWNISLRINRDNRTVKDVHSAWVLKLKYTSQIKYFINSNVTFYEITWNKAGKWWQLVKQFLTSQLQKVVQWPWDPIWGNHVYNLSISEPIARRFAEQTMQTKIHDPNLGAQINQSRNHRYHFHYIRSFGICTLHISRIWTMSNR